MLYVINEKVIVPLLSLNNDETVAASLLPAITKAKPCYNFSNLVNMIIYISNFSGGKKKGKKKKYIYIYIYKEKSNQLIQNTHMSKHNINIHLGLEGKSKFSPKFDERQDQKRS